MFDFEWINANLYGGAYSRSKSFFDDSELSSAGRPASRRASALCSRPFPGAVRDDVMEGNWRAARLRRLGPRPRARPPRARLLDARRAMRSKTARS